jgi:hypothetical protein
LRLTKAVPARWWAAAAGHRKHADAVTKQEAGMIGKTTLIRVGIVTALGVVGASVASAQQEDRRAGDVTPCSLSGVNPADHPGIFGNPQVAREQYGFVKAPDGSWTVMPNCESQFRR